MVTGDNALSALPISFLSSVLLLSPLAASFLPLLMLIHLCERISQRKDSGCETDQYILLNRRGRNAMEKPRGTARPNSKPKIRRAVRNTPKATASGFHQLLGGHALTASLKEKWKWTDPDSRCRCKKGRQTREHHFRNAGSGEGGERKGERR